MQLVCSECGGRFPEGTAACPQDGGKLAPWGDDPLLGEMVGSYRLTKLLGEGGMGRVYRGIHAGIGARVAVKVLNAEWARNREIVERFFAEARAVNVVRHEGIVNILDLNYLPDGRPFIVMEYLDGQPLTSLIRALHPLPLGALAALTQEVLDALAAAHAKGIVHRDLKPDNIFVTPVGRAKVLDFGIAKLSPEVGAMSGPTRAGAIMGTPPYMSPEQARGMTVDHRSDIYTMGVILYEATTGRLPFHSDSTFDLLRMHIEATPVPPSTLRPDLPKAYEAVILRAMEKDPTRRFASVQEMTYALGVASQEIPPERWGTLRTANLGAMPGLPSIGAVPRTAMKRTSSRVWIAVVGGVAGLAFAVVLAVVLIGRKGPEAAAQGGGGGTPPPVVTPDAAPKAPPKVDVPRFTAMRSNQGWTITFVFRRPPLALSYRVGAEGEFESTGANERYLDPDTGQPTAVTWTSLPLDTRKTVIQVKYQTGDGSWHGPFDLPFDPMESAIRETKELLRTGNWVAFRDFDGRRLVYFTALIGAKHAIGEIRYGVDTDTPTQTVRFEPPKNAMDPSIAPDDEIQKEIPREAKRVVVQVTYRDGTQSPIKSFKVVPQ